MAKSTQSNQRPGDKPSLVSRIFFWLLGLLLTTVVVIYATLYFGGVHGQEFSPDTFSRREFNYHELPLFRFKVTPTVRTNQTGDLEKYLVMQKLVPQSARPEERWDRVYSIEGSSRQSQGDAWILCRYFDSVDKDEAIVWLSWSKSNTELAKIVWPAVAKLARQELYSFTPEIFVLARSATNAKELQADIDKALAKKYLFAARTFQALENHEAAVELFAEALVHSPNSIEALEGRAQSLDRTGKATEAAVDTAHAQELKGDL